MKINAIEGANLVDSAVRRIPVEDRAETIHFAVSRDEGNVLLIESDGEVSRDDLDIGSGFMYRVHSANTESYIITLLA